MFKKVLACSDLTPGSASAVRAALTLSPLHDALICALHVVPLPPQIRRWDAPIFRDDVKAYYELLARQIQEATKELQRQVTRLAGGTTPAGLLIRVESGDVAPVIAATADALRVDIIIVARGTGGKLGRTAEQVVRMAGRTVLVAPVKSRTNAEQRVARSEPKRATRATGKARRR